jgi:hypothetical protein
MKRFDVRTVAAILLIVVGILLLLQNVGILGGVVALIWSLIFAAGGLVFLYVFLTNRVHWWALIPGFALLSIAALIALDQFLPRVGDALGGTIVLGGIGLAFWVIYFLNREHWWAVIPGGVLATLTLIVGLESVFEGDEIAGILFLGLGLTFGVLYFLPSPQGRMKWAIFPAAILLVMGLLFTVAAIGAFQYLGALALILIGLYLLYRMFRSR